MLQGTLGQRNLFFNLHNILSQHKNHWRYPVRIDNGGDTGSDARPIEEFNEPGLKISLRGANRKVMPLLIKNGLVR